MGWCHPAQRNVDKSCSTCSHRCVDGRRTCCSLEDNSLLVARNRVLDRFQPCWFLPRLSVSAPPACCPPGAGPPPRPPSAPNWSAVAGAAAAAADAAPVVALAAAGTVAVAAASAAAVTASSAVAAAVGPRGPDPNPLPACSPALTILPCVRSSVRLPPPPGCWFHLRGPE